MIILFKFIMVRGWLNIQLLHSSKNDSSKSKEKKEFLENGYFNHRTVVVVIVVVEISYL